MKNNLKLKKKAFTLIELLAVIIVLAIIALIATPIIFNVIENAKLKALENSCYGVIDAVKTLYAENLLNSEDGKVTLSGEVDDLILSGEHPYYGTWEIDNSSDSTDRGIKIENVKFKSMKNYTCSNTLEDGTITNEINCSKDGQDNTTPTITAKQTTVTVNEGTDQKIKKYFDVTFGVTGGEVICEVENVNTLSVGDYTIKCIATGTNGKTDEASINLTVVLVLKDEILKETLKGTNITWSTAWKTSDESGLYAQSVEDKTTYYFRGQPTNNYLKFAGLDFRILRVNEDGSIRIMLTNFIDSKQFNTAYNTYDKMYYTNSELKTVINNWYEKKITGEFANKVINGSFCEAARVVPVTTYTVGNADVVVKENYTPTFSCTTDGNGKGNVTASVGLVTYDEVIFAGEWYASSSSSYLSKGHHYWTMSPAGFTNTNIPFVWLVNEGGFVNGDRVDYSLGVLPVINLKSDTLVIGNGTNDNPYVVK